MDSNLGAVGVAQSFGNFHLASNLTPNPLNIIWHTGTMACLLRQKAVVFKTSGVIRNGQSTYNASITTSSGNLRFIKDGSGGTPTNITSSIPLVTGAPYFIAVSWDDAVAVNFVVRRMDTGQLYSETQADTTAMALTSDGLPIAETNGGNFLNVAALAFSTVNLARYELINMAADPWSLWYADGDEQFVGMIPAATIKFRKTLSQVGTRIGARQIQGWSQ